MPNLYETIYPSLSSRYSEKVLHLNFTPTAADIAFVKSNAKQHQPQTILLILLKVTEHLHYIPIPEDIPYRLVKYIANAFSEHKVLQKKQLGAYQKSGTFKRHYKLICNYLNLDINDKKRMTFCDSIGVKLAETKDNLVDIMNALIEALIIHQFELPAFSSIERLARGYRQRANENIYHQVCQHLSKKQRVFIASLFHVPSSEHESAWQRLKQAPDKPTVTRIRVFLDHLLWLKTCADSLPSIEGLPISKRNHFRYEAMALHSSDMRQLKVTKRHALAIVLVSTQLAQAYDDLAEIFTRLINDIQNTGKQDFQDDLFESRNRANALITQFRHVLSVYQSSAEIKRTGKRLEKIDAAFSESPDTLLQSCDTHLALVANDERPHVVQAFNKKRKLLFEIFEQLPIQVDASLKPFLALGKRLLTLYQQSPKQDTVDLKIHPNALELMAKDWEAMIFPDDSTGKIHRFSLETAWFLALKTQLKTFNCFIIGGGEKYGDPHQQLITWEEYPALA